MNHPGKTTLLLAIIILSGIPIFFITSYVVKANEIRVLEPTIGAAQFTIPDDNLEVYLSCNQPIPKGDFLIKLYHVDFSFYNLSLPILDLRIERLGIIRITVHIPNTIMIGLYELEVKARSIGAKIANPLNPDYYDLSTIEENSVYVYNSTRPLRFAHITDIHVNKDNTLAEINTAPPHMPEHREWLPINDLFEGTMEELSFARPDFVLITGDISTANGEIEYKEIVRILSKFKVAALCTSGNHDYRSPPSYEYYLGPHFYSRVFQDWRIIILDSGSTEGNGLLGEQLAFYENELKEATRLGQHVAMGMHSPSAPIPGGGLTIAGNEEFRFMNDYYNVTAIFTGHHHEFSAHDKYGNELYLPDPITVAMGPVYVESDSPTITYGFEVNKYAGWRMVECFSDGSMNIGYDFDNSGISNIYYGLPRFGLNITETPTKITINNTYLKVFNDLIVPITREITVPNQEFTISEGIIIDQKWSGEYTAIWIKLNLPKNTTIEITITPV